MKPLILMAGMAAMVCLTGWTHGETLPTPSELKSRAEVIKPSAAELRWQRIPWQTDLAKGQRVAGEERRPLLLWVTGDDPLERC